MKALPALSVVLLSLALSPRSYAQTVTAKEFLLPLPAGKEWKLIWNDEFDGTTLDETKWNRLGDWKRRDGYWVKEDAYLSGKGTLLLRTQKDGDRYTCGAVNTQGKFEHAFGYYVARCKMPKEPGHWPAFWMMGSGVGKVGNEGRDGTEIDIVEIPWRDGKVTFNLHWDGYGKEHKSAGTNATFAALAEGFHDYALLWTPEEYVFYVDAKEVGSAFGMGGLAARLRHHRGIAARPHWHIDYLRVVCDLVEVWFTTDAAHLEHLWAKTVAALSGAHVPLPGFGSSDCDCPAHLYAFNHPLLVRAFRHRLNALCPTHGLISSWRVGGSRR